MTQLIDMVKDERYILESFYDLHFICLWKRFELNAKCLFIYYLIKLLCNHEIYHVIYKHLYGFMKCFYAYNLDLIFVASHHKQTKSLHVSNYECHD
jgi:hypothetical protein